MKMGDKSEILDVLLEKEKEELNDVCSYNELYEKLKADGHHEDAAIIEMIARDEYSHAKALCEELKEHGYHNHDDAAMSNLWRKANAAFGME